MKYIFKGIDCINCSNSLEKYLKLNGFDVKINFLEKIIEIDDKIDRELLIKKAKSKEIYFEIIENDINLINKNIFFEYKSTFLSLIVFIIAFILDKYVYMYLRYDRNIYYISNYLYIISFTYLTLKLYIDIFKMIKEKNIFNEKILMGVSILAAIYLRLFEEVAMLVIMYNMGLFLQSYSILKSKNYINKLISKNEEKVKLSNGSIKNINEVKKDDEIILSLGEKVLFDCKVIEGTTEIDIRAISGETKTIFVKKNDLILAGSINVHSIIKVKVIKDYKNSNISKMKELIEKANLKKNKLEEYIVEFSKIYTPIMFLIAILSLILPPIIFQYKSFEDSLYTFLTILIISCPCSLVFSIPLVFFNLVGRASKEGIIIKNINSINNISKMNTLILDKTGTITKGNFHIKKIIGNFETIKEYIYYTVINSNHLISKAILKYINKNYEIQNIVQFEKVEEIPGMGIVSYFESEIMLIGNYKLLSKYYISVEKEDFLYIYFKNNIIKIILEDEIKEDSKEAIEKIKKNINRVVMLSGDNENICFNLSKKVIIDEYYSNLLPKDKLEIVEDEIKKGKRVLFIGDGINDAPSLARADIGISMGFENDINLENSDIIFKNSSLNDLIKLFKLSRILKIIIIINLIIILSVKFLILFLSFYTFIPLWISIFSDVGISLISIINSMVILKVRL